MLPDYPITKNKIYQKIILKRYQAIRDACIGPLAGIPVARHFEGNLNDDGRGPREYHETTSELSIGNSELEAMTPQQVMERIDVLLLDMARQQGEFIFRHFVDIAEAGTGNVTVGNTPLDADLFLQALEKLYIEFDKTGQPNISKLDYLGPEGAISFEVLCQQLLNTLESRARYEAILAQKREEWRDRESTRKLVD